MHKCYRCVSNEIITDDSYELIATFADKHEVIKNAGREGCFRLASIGALISSCTHPCLHDQSILAATLQASDGAHMTSMYGMQCMVS